MQLPAPGANAQPSGPSPIIRWADHLGRVSYIRGHISVFAAGSVVLLALDLLSGDGAVWADTLIIAWAVLLLAHGILALIARLLGELLASDTGGPHPASGTSWTAGSTWALPTRPDETAPETSPAAAPSAEEPSSTPPPAAKTERVSWKEATKAAWLPPRDTPAQPGTTNDDDPNDFTPLKLD